METVSLLLGDDHPLIQLGFRGTIRLPGEIAVLILGGSGPPRARRRLPVRKRRALLLMAEGCEPPDLAGRLGLCLEHAEALYEELTQKFGLDRIDRQVRSALRSGSLRSGRGTIDSTWGGILGNRVRDLGSQRGSRIMADQELVRILFPDALARCQANGEWMVLPDPEDQHLLGSGPSESDAWTCAAVRLCQDEWFRPILTQLMAIQSARQAGA
ncbi:hypothetical protein AB1L88_05690 [Tautonia sp. JC769]|uniref:hypothetical protein n=1 Tax=Tautonia sp. JC769 TaxID=3232135 RepID=UPI003459FFF5